MVRKSGLILLLMFLLIFACASIQITPDTLYHGIIRNNTQMVVHVAIVDILPEDEMALWDDKMLGPGEIWTVDLPAGHYHIVASCSKGYYEKCFQIPEMLKDPTAPWSINFYYGKPPVEA